MRRLCITLLCGLVAVPAALAGARATGDGTLELSNVNGTATLVRVSGSRLRRVQTGYVRNYALAIATGAALVLAYVASRVGS